jgi:curved DNA-binding protein
MSEESDTLGVEEARLILGVDASAGDEALRRAFRAAVKLAHPDRPGGDDARLRRVIEAYRRLRPDAPPPRDRRPRIQSLIITPADAVLGGWRTARLGAREVRLHLPAGLREGEPLSLDGRPVTVAIAGEDGAAVLGDHLCLTVRVAPSLLRRGGRVYVDTPMGSQAVWVSRPDAAKGLARVEGGGLPARGGHARGHLFVRLLAAKEQVPETVVQRKLRRFTAAWAA